MGAQNHNWWLMVGIPITAYIPWCLCLEKMEVYGPDCLMSIYYTASLLEFFLEATTVSDVITIWEDVAAYWNCNFQILVVQTQPIYWRYWAVVSCQLQVYHIGVHLSKTWSGEKTSETTKLFDYLCRTMIWIYLRWSTSFWGSCALSRAKN